jgi:hypothetical protein
VYALAGLRSLMLQLGLMPQAPLDWLGDFWNSRTVW